MRIMRCLCGSILGLALCWLPAFAQTPQNTVATKLPGWDLAIDPDKDCKFTPGPRSLTIDVPAAYHDLTPALESPKPKLNAPRVWREVDGDFVLTVKVSGDFKPRSPTTRLVVLPQIRAGIFLWSDSDNFIRLERGALLRDNRIHTGIDCLKIEYGDESRVDGEALKEGDCYLRLERKGNQILGAISNDGAIWKQLKAIDTVLPKKLSLPSYIRTENVWPKKLKVGLMAISTSSAPFSVKFEQIELTTK